MIHVDVPLGADHAFFQFDDALRADQHAAGRAVDLAAGAHRQVDAQRNAVGERQLDLADADRVGPSTRTVGSIRRRGPTTITVSAAA